MSPASWSLPEPFVFATAVSRMLVPDASAQEGLLLRVGELRRARELGLHLGVRRLHGVAGGGEQRGEGRGLDAQQAHRAHRAAQQAAQHVAAALVGRRHAVGHQHERAADVVGDHAETDVVLVRLVAIRLARQLGRAVEHRAHLVDLVHVVDALLDERDALQAQAGVDVLLRQVAEDVEVLLAGALAAQVLHEDEVPDLDVAVVIRRRAAVDAVGRAAVEEDLRARARRAGLAGRPVVGVLAEALDALGREAGDAGPDLAGLLVLLVHRDPEVLRVEAEAALVLGQGEEVPGERDRLLLEVVAEREVAAHLEERAVAGVLPTSSMSSVRMHFWTLVARGNGAGTTPVRYGTNGTIPATVNSSDGSSLTSEADGTTV